MSSGSVKRTILAITTEKGVPYLGDGIACWVKGLIQSRKKKYFTLVHVESHKLVQESEVHAVFGTDFELLRTCSTYV